MRLEARLECTVFESCRCKNGLHQGFSSFLPSDAGAAIQVGNGEPRPASNSNDDRIFARDNRWTRGASLYASPTCSTPPTYDGDQRDTPAARKVWYAHVTSTFEGISSTHREKDSVDSRCNTACTSPSDEERVCVIANARYNFVAHNLYQWDRFNSSRPRTRFSRQHRIRVSTVDRRSMRSSGREFYSERS